MDRARACTGCLLGTAVGDSIGLPFEAIGPARAARMFPGPLAHHLLPRRGMVSDDTEHACFTAIALLRAGGDVDAFGRRLASALRWWLAGLPAGIGLATLRALLKSSVGFPPHHSGVFSAGNGPAMRSPILGVALGDDLPRLRAFVRRSTVITHTDPKAYHGALAVAVAAHYSATAAAVDPAQWLAALREALAGEPADELLALAERAVDSAARGEAVSAFAAAIGSRNGISGYMFHTVPCVLQAWLRHPGDYPAAIDAIVRAGGDTDTTAAILGGIVGARVGREGIPAAWLDGIVEWPRSTRWIASLGDALGHGGPAPGYFVPGIPLRNAVFMIIVLAHGFRRLAPPY